MPREPLQDKEVDALVTHLFRPRPFRPEDTSVYVILDGARDPRIHAAVRRAELPSACLFTGELSVALQAAAPYLVQLRRSSPFTRLVLRSGWGDAWGIFAASTATLEEMRRHLRRFLRVVDESGKRFFFRYYDPRVLRLYLPTCTESELATIFGPVREYIVEAEDRGRLIEHARKDRKLVTAEVGVAEANQRAPAVGG